MEIRTQKKNGVGGWVWGCDTALLPLVIPPQIIIRAITNIDLGQNSLKEPDPNAGVFPAPKAQ